MNDDYAALEVSPLASDEEIKKAYRRLVLKYHPDRNQGNARALIRKMQGINAAFEVLGDPEKRKAYDLEYRFDSQEMAPETQSSPTTEADQGDAVGQSGTQSHKGFEKSTSESGEKRAKKRKNPLRHMPEWVFYALLFLPMDFEFMAEKLQLEEELSPFLGPLVIGTFLLLFFGVLTERSFKLGTFLSMTALNFLLLFLLK